MAKKIIKKITNRAIFWKLYTILSKFKIAIIGEKEWEKRRFSKLLGYEPDLDNPQTLNEKMAWLKLNYFQPFYIECCDKYLLHQYLKKRIGKDMAPHLLFVTQEAKQLTFENITHFPCIIKTSNGSGTNLLLKSRDQYSERYIQQLFSKFIVQSDLHTVISREHQYDIDKAYIVVESLLSDHNGGIPNDYKFLYINGNLEFIYCSVDRLGANVRQVYDKDWNRLHFAWVAGADKTIFDRYDSSDSIPAPKSFEEMKRISSEIAKDFPLVRIDFYDASEGLFIGEITLHHGSAHDRFYPFDFDKIYGSKLLLPNKNR